MIQYQKRYFLIKKILIWQLLLLIFTPNIWGQQRNRYTNDYIVSNDEISLGGKVDVSPKGEITELNFRRFKRANIERFTINDISEFKSNSRIFFRMTLEDAPDLPVFLEVLSSSNEKFILYKFNGDTDKYYLKKKSDERLVLLEDDFREVLTEQLDNPLLESLISITEKSDPSLVYLLENDHRVQKPRTFSKAFNYAPLLSFGPGKIDAPIPSFNQKATQGVFLYGVGFAFEGYVNFKRNISATLSPLLMGFNSADYHQFPLGSGQMLESDISIKWTGFMVPLTVRYYLDLKPQRIRLSPELGYAWVGTFNQETIHNGAFIRGSEVFMENTPIIIPDRYQGLVFGVNLDYILKNQKTLTFSFKRNQLSNQNTSGQFNSLLFSIGIKF